MPEIPVEVRYSTLARALEDVWDDGNAADLDGWIGPGRGAGEIDDEAVRCRERIITRALNEMGLLR